MLNANDFIGKKVIKDNKIFTVINARDKIVQNGEKDFLIFWYNNKEEGCAVKGSVLNNKIEFQDIEFQNTVELWLQENIQPSRQGVQFSKMTYAETELLKILKGNGIKKDISFSSSINFGKLEPFTKYGKNSKNIYESCCFNMNWNLQNRKYFGSFNLLYAEDCTPDHLNVHFISYSNLTNDKAGAINEVTWVNVLHYDSLKQTCDFIVQFSFFDDTVYYSNEEKDKYVFVKQGDGEYVYLGRYTLESTKKYYSTKKVGKWVNGNYIDYEIVKENCPTVDYVDQGGQTIKLEIFREMIWKFVE